jgi:hypothetical protein
MQTKTLEKMVILLSITAACVLSTAAGAMLSAALR